MERQGISSHFKMDQNHYYIGTTLRRKLMENLGFDKNIRGMVNWHDLQKKYESQAGQSKAEILATYASQVAAEKGKLEILRVKAKASPL